MHVPGKGDLTPFALEVGAHALRFFADYFGIPYPADKLDLVAIPDFAFGAMENLGCVTFRESVLLVDPAQSARVELERVADVVCHEIAHMWFGDLVTMRWWNGIWLNEAFATFMEVLAVDAFRPEWQRWVSFGVEREAALAVDGLHATRPVEFPVGRPEEAQGMFDVLTYQKGGGVLRMLEQFLGPDVFREGINDYLTTHSYGNTETGGPVGRPRAIQRAGRARHHGHLDPPGRLPAGRGWATTDPSPRPRSPTAGEPGGRHRLDVAGPRPHPVPGRSPRSTRRPSCWAGTPVLRRSGAPSERGPTVVNAGGSGYYRVAYPTAMVERLAGRLGELAPLERYNLVADTWAARRSRARPPDRLPPPGPRPRRLGRGRPERLVRGHRRPRRCSTGSSPTTTDRSWPGRSGPCSAPWPRPGLGSPAEDDGERTPSLRASVLRTLGTVGATRGPGRGRPALRRRRRQHPRTPTPSRPSWTSWPPTAARRSSRPSWPATGPGHPPGGDPLPLRPGPFADPSWPCGPSSWP